MTKQEIAWDLSEIFPGTSDSSVEKAFSNTTENAKMLAETYHGKIKDLSLVQLKKCITDFEAFHAKLQDITLYAGLSFSANMTLPEVQSLHDRSSKLEAKLGKMLAFFDLEIGNLIKTNPKIVTASALSDYRHWLERMKRQVAHQLSEIEEQLVIEKDQFGIEAFEELQNKWLNTRRFEVKVERKKRILPYGKANGLLSHPDRATRESANKSIYGLLGKDGEIFASALRNICNDWVSVCERRKFDSPMHASLIANDTEQKIIDNLLKAIEDNTGMYRSYLKLKAKLMHLPKLGCHDLIAPLPGAPKLKFTFEKARELVTQAYGRFDEEYATAVKDMFTKSHLDASPRYGKENGAFCAGWYTGKTAYILSSFNGRLNDIYTLAHELGHATHDYYAQRKQTPMNLNIPMTVAETASTFGELLLTDLLLNQAKTNKEKKTILCHVLDGAGMSAFQVTARAWFEQSLYDAIKKEEYLEYKTICKHWVKARNRIYGNAVNWFREMEAEWTMKPHYYMANFRFYNYPYVYAQMFVYALYQKYKQEGKAFVPKFKKALTAGSSIRPAAIARTVDLDVTTRSFWNLGMKTYKNFLTELEDLAKSS